MRRAEYLMLLLTCPLGRKLSPLTMGEYRRVAQYIRQSAPTLGEQPMTKELLLSLGCDEIEAEKVMQLLQSEQAAQRYLAARHDISILTRLSEQFPKELRRLHECPSALFCLGDLALLTRPKISLVGNRRLSEDSAAFAAGIGQMAALQGYVLVSGGAVGADSIAQDACLQAGGSVISILPASLPRHAKKNVLYCSDEGYASAFTAHRALRRNHYIHALGERCYVAQCLHTSGGTWEGCVDNLKRKLSPLYLRDDGSEGVKELFALGAQKYEANPYLRDCITHAAEVK